MDGELGFDLEQNTTTVRSALECRSEDIARRVDDQSCVGIGSINAAAEAMEDFLGPAPSRCGSQFVHRTVTVGAAIVGRAVEIAGGIGYYASQGVVTIRAIVAESMQVLLCARAVCSSLQLKHCADDVYEEIAPCCAVEVAGRVEDQAGPGIATVRAVVVEIIQHHLSPCASRLARQLEHRAVDAAVRAAVEGCTVEIASRIPSQAGEGGASIRAVEVEQQCLGPDPARVRRQLVHRTAVFVRTPSRRHAVEISRSVA